MQVMTTGYVWHSDQETAASISTTALAGITRAYAKVIADTMTVDLRDLRGPQRTQQQ